MNILVITYALNGLLMIAIPVGLAIFLTHRWKLDWRIWWIGFATFVLSQVGHIPFNGGMTLLLNRTGIVYWSPTAQLLFNAVFLGLSAGLFEEGARYLILRFWARDARSWRTGTLFGAGHGGSEAIIFGCLALYGYIRLVAFRDATPEQLSQFFGSTNVALAQTQLAAAWSAPWYETLFGALERFFAIPCQIAMALMVMQVFTRRKIGWLFAAIVYHAMIDGTSVILMYQQVGPFWFEAVVGLFAVLSVGIIFLLRRFEPPSLVAVPDLAAAPVPSTSAPAIKPVDESHENLDNTRFQ